MLCGDAHLVWNSARSAIMSSITADAILYTRSCPARRVFFANAATRSSSSLGNFTCSGRIKRRHHRRQYELRIWRVFRSTALHVLKLFLMNLGCWPTNWFLAPLNDWVAIDPKQANDQRLTSLNHHLHRTEGAGKQRGGRWCNVSNNFK